MKIIPRIYLILLAALVVVGATMALTNFSGTAQAAANFQGQPPQTGDRTIVAGQRQEGEHDGGSALGRLSHLIPIAAIIFIVVSFETLWKRFFRPRLVQATVK